MQRNYKSFIQIINFHGLFRNALSEVPKNWCLPNTGAFTVSFYLQNEKYLNTIGNIIFYTNCRHSNTFQVPVACAPSDKISKFTVIIIGGTVQHNARR